MICNDFLSQYFKEIKDNFIVQSLYDYSSHLLWNNNKFRTENQSIFNKSCFIKKGSKLGYNTLKQTNLTPLGKEKWSKHFVVAEKTMCINLVEIITIGQRYNNNYQN